VPKTVAELNAMQDERATCIADAGKIVAKARAESDRPLTAEETQEFERLHARAGDIYADLQKEREAKARIDRQAEAEASLRESRGRRVAPAEPGAGAARGEPTVTFGGRPMRLPPNSAAARRAGEDYVDAFRAYLGGDVGVGAALQTDSAADGGYLAPPQFVATIIAEMNNSFWFRQLARVLPPTTAPKVTMPRRRSRLGAFVWGSELATTTALTTPTLGTYNLTPHYMAGEVEVSNDLIRASVVDTDSFVRGEINFGAGDLEENAFFTGDGVNKPVGIYNTTHPDGIPTSRDVSGDITDYATWVAALYSLREPYLRSPNLRWLLHRNGFKVLSTLETSAGEPIWLVNTRDNKPDTLLGKPVVMSEYSPAGNGANGTYNSADYVGTVGDFGCYDILDGLDLTVNVMTDSYYARRNMIGYIVRRKVDGCPQITEAFARIKKS